MNSKQSVSFHNREGNKLAGILTLPKGASPEQRVPGILLCQGLSGVKNLVMPEIADFMADAGFASLAFDYSGYGESEGEKGWIDPPARVDDACYACSFLAQCPEVDQERIGVYGLSYGGPVAVCVLSRESNAKCTVAVSAPGNGWLLIRSMRTEDEWLQFVERVNKARSIRSLTGESEMVDVFQIFPFSKTFLDKYSKLKSGEDSSSMRQQDAHKQALFHLASADAIMNFHPEDEVRHKGDKPLLLVTGEKDDVATVVQVQEIYDNAPESRKLVIVPGLDHVDLDAGEGLHRQLVMSVDWFREHL